MSTNAKFAEYLTKLLTLSNNILKKIDDSDPEYRMSQKGASVVQLFHNYMQLANTNLQERSIDFESCYKQHSSAIQADLHNLLLNNEVFLCPSHGVVFDIGEIYRVGHRISTGIIARYKNFGKDVDKISKIKQEVLFPDGMRLHLLRIFSLYATDGSLNGKVRELEVKFGIAQPESQIPFGPPSGIMGMVKQMMSSMGVPVPTEGIPDDSQFESIATKIMGNTEIQSAFEGITQKAQGGNFNDILSEVVNTLQNKEVMETLKNTLQPTIEEAKKLNNQQ